jgi:CBS domain-containing protein
MNSSRRTRREPTPGEFHDPLSNYDPPVYADDLEKSLMEDPVGRAIPSQPFHQATAETTVGDVIALMAEHGIASLVIVDGENKPIGIFSERDVLNRVSDNFAAIAEEPIKGYMTPNPVVVHDNGKPARVVNLMSEGLFRHVPLVDADGKLTGVIGARRVIAYLQQFFSEA